MTTILPLLLLILGILAALALWPLIAAHRINAPPHWDDMPPVLRRPKEGGWE